MLFHARYLRRLVPICCLSLLVSYAVACSSTSEATPVPPTRLPTLPAPTPTSAPPLATATIAPTSGTIDLSQARPATVHTVPPPLSDGPPPNLTDVYFVTAQTGFGVTANGGIYRSSDGGATWQVRFRRGGARFTQVVFSDAKSGMALGTSDCLTLYNNCEGSAILARTSDGGDTWDVIEPKAPTPGIASALPFLTIAIVSPEVSYAVRDPDQQSYPIDGFANGLLATNDGGIHWQSVSLPQKTYAMGGISFLNPAQGYITTWREDTKEYQILATTDGGQHWEVRYSDPAFPLYAVQFLDAQHGFAGGGAGGKESSSQQLFTTDDGGMSWHLVYRHDTSWYGHAITRIRFSSLTNGWFATGACLSLGQNGPCGGSLWHTMDGGYTWTPDANNGWWSGIIRFSNVGDVAWVILPGKDDVGRGGPSVLYHTTDGGAGWQPLWRPEALESRRVQFINPQIGWMDTNVGLIQTRDSGKHWTPYSLGAPVTAEDRPVFVSDSLVLAMHTWDLAHYRTTYVAYELFRSEDGGRTWQSIPLPPLPPPCGRGSACGQGTEITFAGPDNGWLMFPLTCRSSDCPMAIFVTTDGGRSWKQQSSPDVAFVRATIAFGDAEHGIVLGDRDYASKHHLLLTNDGGRTWSEQTLPFGVLVGPSNDLSPPSITTSDLWLVGAAPNGTGGGGYGALTHSDDNGQHWTVWLLKDVRPFQVRFVTPLDGWLIASTPGESGALYITHNGGQDWQQVWPEISP